MRLSVVRYLQWVFPALLNAHDGYVRYDGQKYKSERDLIISFYSNFLALPEKYYAERGFGKVWGLVNIVADDD